MNHGRIQLAEGELREPKKKKVKPGTLLRDPYPIIFWNKLGIPPCKELWPNYMGVFDGDSVIVEDPRDMHEISTMGYFGKRLMCRRGYEQSIGDVPVVRERQWKRRVEWAAECGYVLVPPDKDSDSGSPDCNAVVDPEGDRLVEVSEAANVAGAEESTEDQGGERESGAVNADRELGVDVPCEQQGKSDGCEEAGAATGGGDSAASEEGRTEVSEDSRKESSPSVASGSVPGEHGGDERKDCAGECRVSPESLPSKGDKETVAAVLEGKEGCGHEMAVLQGERKEVESGKPRGEEGGSGNVQQSCEAKGEAAMDVSTDRPSSGDRVDKPGEGGESPAVTSSKEEDDSKQGGEVRGETGTSSLVEVESEKGVDSPVGKGDEVSQPKKGGSMRGCQVTRISPRSTRSSASKLKESESGDCDSLGDDCATKPANGVAGRRVRRNLRKSLAGEEAGDASDSKGDSCKALNAGDAKSDGGSVHDSEGDEGKDKLLEVAKEKECLVDLVSKTMGEEVEREEASSCAIGVESNAVQEKLNESVDCGEVEGEKEGETDKCVGEGEGDRTPGRHSRRGRGSKRNRSQSTERVPSGGKEVDVESGDGNGEEVSEDAMDVAVVKRPKVCDAAPEEEGKQKQQQPEEVSEKTADSSQNETGEGSTSSKQESELVKGAVENEGSDSGEKMEANEQCSHEGLAEEKMGEISMNKSSSDCEIVEIEDESNTQTSIVPGGEKVLASTPHKCSEDLQVKDAPCVSAADSDDDIMEVSIEEEEVREVARDGQMIVNRRRSSSNFVPEGTMGNNNGKNFGEPEKIKFQKMLLEIRKNLPRDIEVTEVNLKNLKEAEATAKKDPRKEEATNVDNEDDDVIEINLQKSDMMELEGCAEEEVAEGGDGEVECSRDEQTSFLQRRMRKESSGFHRKEREGFGDSSRVKQDPEVESVTTGNQGSICEVAPCIVIPDSDSDVEESQGSPRLESDPSVFLPSLDVLQLIPEEAFFLAYGLGCLVVWDARNIECDPNKYEDDQGGMCSDELKPHIAVKVENGDLGNKVGNGPPSSTGLDEGEHTRNACESGGDRPSKSINGCDMGHQSVSSNRGTVTSSSVKDDKVESLMVAPSKLDSVEGNKFPLNQTEPSVSPNTSSVEEVPSKETPSKKPSLAGDSADVGQEIKIPMKKISEEEVGVLAGTNKSDQAPVESLSQQSEADLGNKKDVGGEKKSNSADSKDTIRELSGPPKENGVLGDPSITVIDLADSPPSRQWAGKSWPSQDEEDVVAMDTDISDVSLIDPEPSMPENPSERTLRSEYQRPMSILELWNAFRSCRASVSSSIPFETTYAVYHHFRSKRWVVKPGIRFGGDFLLYKDGPPFYHASYLVVIDSFGPDGESKFDWKKLSGMNRLAENIAKDLMLCRVEWPPTVTEKELQSPECLMGLVVQEVLVRRWVSLKEREAEDHLEEEEDDRESFIPLKLNL